MVMNRAAGMLRWVENRNRRQSNGFAKQDARYKSSASEKEMGRTDFGLDYGARHGRHRVVLISLRELDKAGHAFDE